MLDFNIKNIILEKKSKIITDIKTLVKIPSIRNLDTTSTFAPFGKDIRDAFDEFINIAERENFKVEDFHGYALHVECGEGEEIIGVLGHLDIMPIFNYDQWHSPPFELDERDGFIFGRGVNDDKGPIIAALYALIILKELNVNFKRKVRLIIGGAEETTWECMKYYFDRNPQPTFGFSPDGDFPIVNGEKGILFFEYTSNEKTDLNGQTNLIEVITKEESGFVCDFVKVTFEDINVNRVKKALLKASKIEIDENKIFATYEGISALSRNPHRGENALFKFSDDLKNLHNLNNKGQNLCRLLQDYFAYDIYGDKVKLKTIDSDMGTSTMCLTNLNYTKDNFTIKFDFRYPKGIDKTTIINTFTHIAKKENLLMKITKDLNLLYVDKNSPLIQCLKTAYKNVVGQDAELFSKGGASYARVLKEGVAFGPTMQGDVPNSHKSNENIRLETLYTAIEIYCEAIYLLACK